MQWNGASSPQGTERRPAFRGVLDLLQERAQPFIDRMPEHARPVYGSVLQSGADMLPGVGDVVAVEDLQTAAQDNDWGGIGLGLLSAIPGIPAIGKGSRRGRGAARRGIGLMDAHPSPQAPVGLMGRSEADDALARYRAANPEDTGARVLNPGDEGYPANAQWDEASQAYVALTPTHEGAFDISVGGRPAGSVSMAPNGRPFVDRIQIDPAFQRQGVGGQVYDQIEETLGVPLVPSPLGLSDEAQGFWRKRLASLDPAIAQTRINQAMDYGHEFGVDAYDRLTPLRASAPEPSLASIIADAEAQGVRLDVSEGRNGITLSRIEVPQDARSQGVGSAIMKALEGYADSNGVPMALTPSGDFGGSVPRLQEFYQRFGFRPNVGRSRDFSTRESMIRQPR
jgi:GNAT superfamily N-acetyltransferase